MTKKLFTFFLIILFMTSFISALTAEISLNTRPYKSHVIRVFDPYTGEMVSSLYPKADGSGLAFSNFSTIYLELSFDVLTVENGIIKDSKRVDKVSTSSPIFVDLLEGIVNTTQNLNDSNNIIFNNTVSNNTVSNESNDTSSEGIIADESTPPLTGETTRKISDFFDKSILYVIGIILIIAVLITLIVHFKNSGFMKMRRAALHTDDKPPRVLSDPELEKAEKRLKEAEKSLMQIRELYTKRATAHQKYTQAKKELEDLDKNWKP